MLEESLKQEDFGCLALRRTMGVNRERLSSLNFPTISFDASPWDGGAVLRRGNQPMEYFSVKWTDATAAHLKVVTGTSRFQTFWEFLALYLVLLTWGHRFHKQGLRIFGDNTGALEYALRLCGKGVLMHIARELSWRKIRGGGYLR